MKSGINNYTGEGNDGEAEREQLKMMTTMRGIRYVYSDAGRRKEVLADIQYSCGRKEELPWGTLYTYFRRSTTN